MLPWALLCALFVISSPLEPRAQEPKSGNTLPAQAEPDAGASRLGQKLTGLAAILNVSSIEGDPLFHADGYRIRVQPGTVTVFSGSLKELADVLPGTWIHFEGVRDNTGTLIARKAEFFPPGSRSSFSAMGPRTVKRSPDYQHVTRDGIIDADGNLFNPRSKVRLSEAGGPCGWHRVPADPLLQERVERIGLRLVPVYQRQLPPESSSRIPFRFYAVADDKLRSAFACNAGLILVPKNVVQRLQNEDQLAAVLADAVAFNLQKQLVTFTPIGLVSGRVDVSDYFPLITPPVFIAGTVAEEVVAHEIDLKLERECARMALQLIADAGFDPWQAPEAWRLLEPKDLPRDIQSIKYTREGEYQLSILKAQYSKGNSGPPAELPATAASNSAQ
jgi:hypothetical protein